jgi:AraC family transcriptional regulator of adaptative response / DNA-3-methyladenine glycosylase II
LLLAKRLLTDTDLPVIEVAFASGFSSVRRFNALFKERYRRNPLSLRKAQARGIAHQPLVCEVAYRPPLDWPALLSFLAARAIPGVECIEGGRYMRTAAFGKHRGWISVEPSRKGEALRVELSASLAPVLPQTMAAVKRLFDLMADPHRIAAHLDRLAEEHPGLRVPGAFDGFEVAMRAILGQQVSVKAASGLAGRLAAAFGEPIETPHEQLNLLTPTAERIAEAEPSDIASLGIIGKRAEAIVSLAKAVAEREIALAPRVDIETMMARLKELPGVGEWTAQYIAMRALSWPDAFPHTDLGIRKAMGENNPKRLLALAERWRPWRAYAAMHLWKSLETNACRTEPQVKIA